MTRLFDIAVGLLAGAAVLLACLTAVTRYLAAGLVFDWSDEIVITLLIWSMFLSGFRLTMERSHVSVDLLTHGRGPVWRRRLEIVATLGLLLFSGLMAYAGAVVVGDAALLGERTESTARAPTWVYYAALPVGMALIAAGSILVLLGRGTARKKEVTL